MTRDQQFTTLWTQGHSYTEICEQIGICRSTVPSWRARLGLKPRAAKSESTGGWDRESVDAAIRMRREGKSTSQIGLALGRSKNSVCGLSLPSGQRWKGRP
jgi:DNA-binding NarL/FixJ family response regulator